MHEAAFSHFVLHALASVSVYVPTFSQLPLTSAPVSVLQVFIPSVIPLILFWQMPAVIGLTSADVTIFPQFAPNQHSDDLFEKV
jgi:hypothetical protein